MKNFPALLALVSLLVACSGAMPPLTAVDGGPDDAGLYVDGMVAPDAWTADDAGPSADAGDAALVEVDAGAVESPDAAVEPDAFVAPDVSRDEACARSEAAWAMTTCNIDLYSCAWVAGSFPEARVAACEAAIAYAFTEAAGAESERCIRVMSANVTECHW